MVHVTYGIMELLTPLLSFNSHNSIKTCVLNYAADHLHPAPTAPLGAWAFPRLNPTTTCASHLKPSCASLALLVAVSRAYTSCGSKRCTERTHLHASLLPRLCSESLRPFLLSRYLQENTDYQEKVRFLFQVPLLKRLPLDQQPLVARAAKSVKFPPRTVIIKEGAA